MKFESLNENRYSLEDITKKRYQFWFLLIPFLFLLVYFIHLIVLPITYTDIESEGQIVTFMFYNQVPGDYLYQYLRLAGYLSVLCLIIAVISYITIKRELNSKLGVTNLPILCFLMLCVFMVVSSVLNRTPTEYINGYQRRGEGLITFLAYFLVIYYSCTFIKKERIKELIVNTFLLLDIIVGFMALYDQFINNLPFIIFRSLGVNMIFYNPNFYGYFLSIATLLSLSCFALNKKRICKLFYLLVFILNCVLCNMCNTLGCFLAVLSGSFFLIIMISIRDKRISWSTFLGFILFLLINGFVAPYYADYYSQLIGLIFQIFGISRETTAVVVESGVDSGRIELWKLTIGFIRLKPIIGWGVDGIFNMIDELTGKGMPHNEYLEYTAYFGIPAGLLYIVGLSITYIRGIKWKKYLDDATLVCMVGAFGYIVSAFFGNTMYFIAPFFFIFLGLSTIHKDKEDEFVKLEKYRNSIDSEDLARLYISDVINMQSYAAVQDGNEMEA